MYRPTLESLSDGKEHAINHINDAIIKYFSLSMDDSKQLLSSGNSTIISNRAAWCRTYLKKADCIESPKRGIFKITQKGLKLLESNEIINDKTFLSITPSFAQFISNSHIDSKDDKKEGIAENGNDPFDIMKVAYEQMNEELSRNLLAEILEMNPYEFEELVVKLLIKMGYGRLEYKNNQATKKSGDEGIDGIVTADKLGFDSIYIQAKRFKEDSHVSRPDIQKFAGALMGYGASKGVFFTTSYFSKEAISYAQNSKNLKIVLVDGKRLAKLMIEHDLGVSTVEVYKIKKIDSDFFISD